MPTTPPGEAVQQKGGWGVLPSNCFTTALPCLAWPGLQLGAECVRDLGDGVTHVVATDITDKTRWARSKVGGGLLCGLPAKLEIDSMFAVWGMDLPHAWEWQFCMA